MKRTIYFLAFLTMIAGGCQDEEPAKNETRLSYYTESFDIEGLGFEPQFKITYEYSQFGKLQLYRVDSYNPDKNAMEEQRHYVFLYAGNKVEHINGYLAGTTDPYVEYAYQYLPNGDVSTIMENNNGTGINSEANFEYAGNGIVKVSYVFSNGGSFEYEFDYATGNIVADKTTRGAQLCSDGEYTYDQKKNPFRDLGYVDYLLTNLSANNRLTENINFVACAFPTLVPESYTYEYNDQGYPVSCTTFYKSQDHSAKARKDFFYK